jgi:Putative Ig domain
MSTFRSTTEAFAVQDDDSVTPPNNPADARPTYTATGLPAGLSISADGVISGLVTETGTNTVTVSTAGDCGDSNSVSFVWIIM